MAKEPSIPEAPSGLATTGRLMKDIQSIIAQGRGVSNGNFGMDLSIGIMAKSNGYVRKDLYNVSKKDLLRFDVTRDFLSSFTDYMVVEFQVPAKIYRDVIVKNKSSLMGFIKFGILDHSLHIRNSKGKFGDESVNTWSLSAYVLETEGFNNFDPYADNVSDADLDKIGYVKCKLQLVYPEYEVLNTWSIGLTLNNADMYNTMMVMIERFMQQYEPKIFGNPMEVNRRIETPDNNKKYESITTTDFVIDPNDKDAKVPTLLKMLYNTHESYGLYTSGTCLYVYRELAGHKKPFKITEKNMNITEDKQSEYESENEKLETSLKETSLIICRAIRNVPLPLPYPVDYVRGPTAETIGEPRNVNVMYDKVKAIGGKMVRIFIAPPVPALSMAESTFGCLASQYDNSGKKHAKQKQLAKYSLDIVCTSKPIIMNPSLEYLDSSGDEMYFPSTGNYPRETGNSEDGGIKTSKTADNKTKVSTSTQELFEQADKDSKPGGEKGFYTETGQPVEEGKVNFASQALSTFWTKVQGFFTNPQANKFRQMSMNYIDSSVKMILEWKHSNPWLINPNDLTEVRMEDKRGIFYYLGSVTSIAWTYDFTRKSANSKIQFMGKLSHISPQSGVNQPEKSDSKSSGNKPQKVTGGGSSSNGNSRSRRVPGIPVVDE